MRKARLPGNKIVDALMTGWIRYVLGQFSFLSLLSLLFLFFMLCALCPLPPALCIMIFALCTVSIHKSTTRNPQHDPTFGS
jgi:hypothetical protein